MIHDTDKPVRIDLHTHSIASPDGALTADDYRRMLAGKRLDCIAVTDHDRIDFAQELQSSLADTEWRGRVIVGEEIRSAEGEIIGLFLTKTVPPGMTAAETVAAIHEQSGLVCIPHPFETVRQGMSLETLDAIALMIDMIEVHNGRAVFQNRSKQAYAWAARHGCRGVADSDAHGRAGWGRTYTRVAAVPSRSTLLQLLDDSQYVHAFPGVKAVLLPKLNRLRKTGSIRVSSRRRRNNGASDAA